MVLEIILSISGLGLIASIINIIKIQNEMDDLINRIRTIENNIDILFDDIETDEDDDYYDPYSED